ncbi:leucyl aminopeptidase [Rhodomicrobium sp. Az07]|uniref:leucyl aminopeptidase n=1 Tax=Rhodomicrobium sp. Az07 TaxID=2839034 RepID=UPI001BE6905F|nr:leucyl aminopeptidase [Rhodomicrobium sp. Az07]MBT3069845.1 leucyl aminopeptidase [Rhodomicrobium sp. Az07]
MTELPAVSFASLQPEPKASTAVYFVTAGEDLPPPIKRLDKASAGAISRAIEVAEFKPKRRNLLEILAPHGLKASRLLLVGIGDAKTLTHRDWMDLGGLVRGKLPKKAAEVDVVFAGVDHLPEDAPLGFAEGFGLRSYTFRKYKSKAAKSTEGGEDEHDEDPAPPKLAIFSCWGSKLTAKLEHTEAQLSGVYLARDLVNEPANILTPPEFTARLRALEALGLTVEVLDEPKLKSLGMNALLAVGQGSAQPTSVVVLRWNGAAGRSADAGNIVFVGKGVCFDSGGISIKPGPGMEDMKGDMAGAAAVAGAMSALALRKAPVNAVGIVGLVENMPSGTAMRPGDIVTSASGQTIEILNTDAEGRLVLADLLWYAQEHLEPKLMITLATLTGAILVALGKEYAGLFSNDDKLASEITDAGADSGELAWRMPLSKKYNKLIDGKFADIRNLGGRDAGSITAAQFLQRFVRNGTPWAHLDIAGTGMASPSTDINQSWGSGYGVRLLDRFSEKFHETSSAES